MIITTTDSVEGRQVSAYLGVVSGDAVMGTNIFKDFFAGIRDIVGGRSGAYEKELQKAKGFALEDMQARAATLTGLHRHGAGPGGTMYENALDDDQAEKSNNAVHTIVSVHPLTGRKHLYLNETHTRRFREM